MSNQKKPRLQPNQGSSLLFKVVIGIVLIVIAVSLWLLVLQLKPVKCWSFKGKVKYWLEDSKDIDDNTSKRELEKFRIKERAEVLYYDRKLCWRKRARLRVKRFAALLFAGLKWTKKDEATWEMVNVFITPDHPYYLGVAGHRVALLKKSWHSRVDKLNPYVEDWGIMNGKRIVFKKRRELQAVEAIEKVTRHMDCEAWSALTRGYAICPK